MPLEMSFKDPPERDDILQRITAAACISREEAEIRLSSVEEQHGYNRWSWTPAEAHVPDDLQRLEKLRRLRVLNDLGICTVSEQEDFLHLQQEFHMLAQCLTRQRSGTTEKENEHDIYDTLVSSAAKNTQQSIDILIHGPTLEGFEETEDPPISHKTLRLFLQNAFGIELLLKLRVGKIMKDDRYFLQTALDGSAQRIQAQLRTDGIIQYDEPTGRFFALNKEHYLQAATAMEGVSTAEQLRHLYKIRAFVGGTSFGIIHVGSFGVEHPSDFDYLADLDVSDEDKKRAYILGTIAHEFAHKIDAHFEKLSASPELHAIVDEETSVLREKCVSDYALRYVGEYKGWEKSMYKEDFAETIRIYLTNSSFLQKHYPRRYAFVQEKCPMIQENTIAKILEQQ